MPTISDRLRKFCVQRAVLVGLTVFFGASSVSGFRASALVVPGLDEVVAHLTRLPRMRSFLVSVDGTLLTEEYFNGAREDRSANLKSVSKSIIATLVGIAIDHGYIDGVDTTIDQFFREDLGDSTKRRITIEDLLTMRSGIETTSNRNYGRWVQSRNWVRHVLTRPLVAEPGERMIYSTGSSHLLSAVITEASGMSTHRFANRYLGKPMGITVPSWTTDPQGIYFGGNEMSMTPRDMLAIGQMYLNCGRVGATQVVSEEWVHTSVMPHATRTRTPDRSYGYGWWVREIADYDSFYAWGYGGQFIYVVPELRLVTVMTSSANPGDGLRDHRRSLYRLMEDEIVPLISAWR